MSGQFFGIKKLLPGIILGLVFVSAFALGLYGFSGPNPAPSAPSQVTNGVGNSSPAQAAQEVLGASTQAANPAAEVVQAVPTSEPPALEPVVAQETTQEAQPASAKEYNGENEKKDSGKEPESEEGDDD